MEWAAFKIPYWAVILLMMTGLYGMIAKKNLLKKLVGMHIFQTAIILFFILMSYKKGATLPIITEKAETIAAIDVVNPLPHAMMLTAVVVMVSTLGVALSICILIHRRYGTLDEDEILEILNKE